MQELLCNLSVNTQYVQGVKNTVGLYRVYRLEKQWETWAQFRIAISFWWVCAADDYRLLHRPLLFHQVFPRRLQLSEDFVLATKLHPSKQILSSSTLYALTFIVLQTITGSLPTQVSLPGYLWFSLQSGYIHWEGHTQNLIRCHH